MHGPADRRGNPHEAEDYGRESLSDRQLLRTDADSLRNDLADEEDGDDRNQDRVGVWHNCAEEDRQCFEGDSIAEK